MEMIAECAIIADSLRVFIKEGILGLGWVIVLFFLIRFLKDAKETRRDLVETNKTSSVALTSSSTQTSLALNALTHMVEKLRDDLRQGRL